MTAVEWLFVQMGNVVAGYETELDQGQMLEKALQMEKEQMETHKYTQSIEELKKQDL
jgi:hypothetical protein